MNYSEALEQQLAMLRWTESTEGEEWFAALNTAGGASANEGWTREGITRYICDPLRLGQTFWWTPNTVRLCQHAASTVPDISLTLDLLPANHGCFWYREGDDQAGSAVLLWNVLPYYQGGLHATFAWCPWNERFRRAMPLAPISWVVGTPLVQAIERHVHAWSLWGKDDSLSRDATSTLLRRVAAMLLFLNQRLLVVSQRSAERHVRKRLERNGWSQPPLVRVVELRRKEYIGGVSNGNEGRQDWAFQWMVRGHWRQQPCGHKREQRQARWIAPYIKGPEDKPLKPPRATVFAVVQ